MSNFDNSIFVGKNTIIPTDNYRFNMPGDEMGPDQRVFNENWFNLDIKLKDINDTIISNKEVQNEKNNILENSIAAINNYTIAGQKISQENGVVINYTDIENPPAIPTSISELTNDANFITSTEVNNNYATIEMLNALIKRVEALENNNNEGEV